MKVSIKITMAILALRITGTASALPQANEEKLRTSELRQVLDASNEAQLIPVSIVMKQQATPDQIQTVALSTDRQSSRPAIQELLQGVADSGQAPLLAYLSEQQVSGRVGSRIVSLWISSVVGCSATASVIREIANRDDVAWVNYNAPRDVFMEAIQPAITTSNLAIECGVAQVKAPEVWAQGNTGLGAIIAVIDSGVCWTHPDIQSQIWFNPGEDLPPLGVFDSADANGIDNDGNGFIDDVIGWNFDQGNNLPSDQNSHGSHVAGTIAGDGSSGQQTGVAPDAAIMVLRVGLSFSDEVDVWSAMQYAAMMNADAISMSLGWPHSYSPDRATWRMSCDNVVAAGTAMIVAAGNEGECCGIDSVRTPGDVPSVITVGATDCADAAASFSSRGPVSWATVNPYNDHPHPPGLTKPDVCAPGVNTLSLNICNGYSTKSGTSMATPHVAGAVALLVAESGGNGSLTPAEIRCALESTTVDLGAPGKDNIYGTGRVDALAAVEALSGNPSIVYVDCNSLECFSYKTVVEGAAAVASGGEIRISPCIYDEATPLLINKSLTLKANGGVVLIK